MDISWVSKSQPWAMYIVIRLFLKDRPPMQFGSKSQNLHLYEVIEIIKKKKDLNVILSSKFPKQGMI